MLLLVFAVIIESGRLMWAFQNVNTGVRDATRYLARITREDICVTGGTVANRQSEMETIVRETIGGDTIFPSKIVIDSVSPVLSCVVGSYRVSPAPVVRVTARVTIDFPFSGLFSFGGQSLGTLSKIVEDQSRVYGT